MPHPVPLDLFDPFGLQSKMSPEKKEKSLLAEINNGAWPPTARGHTRDGAAWPPSLLTRTAAQATAQAIAQRRAPRF